MKQKDRPNSKRVGGSMAEDAAGFRRRAEQCRELAARARDEYSRSTLMRMALELEAEADRIDGQEADDED